MNKHKIILATSTVVGVATGVAVGKALVSGVVLNILGGYVAYRWSRRISYSAMIRIAYNEEIEEYNQELELLFEEADEEIARADDLLTKIQNS